MSRIENYLEKTPKERREAAAIAYLASLDQIETVAPDIAAHILQELCDERSHLKLIASENFSSYAVQLAMGNLLTDKYAEGYSHHRFYAGCENIDSIEERAQNELKTIFGAEHAYIQPHSGADANLVAFWSILIHRIQNKEVEKLGKKSLDQLTDEEHETIRQLMVNQRVMGMSLNSGGHLTHGYRHNVSSKMMQSFTYEVDPETEKLDYEALQKQAKEVKPTILLAGYSAYSQKINFAKMREIADSVGAVFMVDMAHFSGLVAGKVFTGEFNPVPYAHILTSTTHKTLRGPRGGFILAKEEFAEVINKGCPLVLGGPLPHVMAAKAVAFREANTPEFCQYAQNVVTNANALAEELKRLGLRIVSGGTQNHLMIVDLSSLNITGRHAEAALREAGLTVNRNAIPNDKNGAWYTSGVRLGTAALTTLGMGEPEMKEVAGIIYETLSGVKPTTVERTGLPSKAKYTLDPSILAKGQQRTKDLLQQYPLYPELLIDSTPVECVNA